MIYLKSFLESKKEKKYKFKKLDIDGFVVYQGKDAVSNDYITLELAKENDIWLHAKGVHGSHVIIKVKDKQPTEITIKKAAEIAAKNSKSTEEKVEVVYCKKKFIKKEPGMKAGEVKPDYINAYTIFVSKK